MTLMDNTFPRHFSFYLRPIFITSGAMFLLKASKADAGRGHRERAPLQGRNQCQERPHRAPPAAVDSAIAATTGAV